jgi:hypothetical protein
MSRALAAAATLQGVPGEQRSTGWVEFKGINCPSSARVRTGVLAHVVTNTTDLFLINGAQPQRSSVAVEELACRNCAQRCKANHYPTRRGAALENGNDWF